MQIEIRQSDYFSNGPTKRFLCSHLKGDVGADVEWILKAGGVVSRGTPNFFAQNERNARSADR